MKVQNMENTIGLLNIEDKRYQRCATPEQVQDAAFATIDAVENNGEEARLTTNQNGQEARLVTNQNGLENRQATQTNASEARILENQNSHYTDRSVEANGWRNSDATRQEGRYNNEATTFFGIKNFEATKDGIKDLLVKSCADTASILTSQLHGFKDIELQAANNRHSIELDAAKNLAAVQMTATINAAAIAKQVAECCCENKTLILEQSAMVKALFTDTENNRLRDALAAEREEKLFVKLRSTLTPAPIATVSL